MHRPGGRKLLPGKLFCIQRKGKYQSSWFTNAAQGNSVIPPKAQSKSVAELGNGTASPDPVQCNHQQGIHPSSSLTLLEPHEGTADPEGQETLQAPSVHQADAAASKAARAGSPRDLLTKCSLAKICSVPTPQPRHFMGLDLWAAEMPTLNTSVRKDGQRHKQSWSAGSHTSPSRVKRLNISSTVLSELLLCLWGLKTAGKGPKS